MAAFQPSLNLTGQLDVMFSEGTKPRMSVFVFEVPHIEGPQQDRRNILGIIGKLEPAGSAAYVVFGRFAGGQIDHGSVIRVLRDLFRRGASFAGTEHREGGDGVP